jgi:hypothetical protein
MDPLNQDGFFHCMHRKSRFFRNHDFSNFYVLHRTHFRKCQLYFQTSEWKIKFYPMQIWLYYPSLQLSYQVIFRSRSFLTTFIEKIL